MVNWCKVSLNSAELRDDPQSTCDIRTQHTEAEWI